MKTSKRIVAQQFLAFLRGETNEFEGKTNEFRGKTYHYCVNFET